MASCNDIGQRIEQLNKQLADLELEEAVSRAKAEILRPKRKQKPIVLRAMTGEQVGVDPSEFLDRVEADAIAMGNETIRSMVSAGFNGRTGPSGSTGRMVNYRLLSPDDENTAAMLEILGLHRANTPAGVELRQTFSENIAAKELMAMAQQTGADPQAVAQVLARKTRDLRSLPGTVYMIAKARWDSASQYADVLDDLANAIDSHTLTDELKTQAGHVAQWAYYFEQLDAQARRKVGQALRSYQFKQNPEVTFVDLNKDIKKLTLDEVKGNTMVADMLKMTTEGNSNALRKLSRAKRLVSLVEGGINDPTIWADLRILNVYRKANLLSSLGSWLVRNPLSGALVQVAYMAEDTYSGTFRSINTNGLLPGVADGVRASFHAGKNFTSAWGQAWSNASEMLLSGKSTMTGDNPKFTQVGVMQDPATFVNETLHRAWEVAQTPAGWANPVNMVNLLNASVWKVLGLAGDRLLSSDVGYAASFRILNSGDEIIRTHAYAWKVNHEAFIRAAKEGRAAGKDPVWMAKRADELAENAIFSGNFTDEQLLEYRRARNAEYGMPIGDEIPDDRLRQMLFDQYHAVPNLKDEIGQLAYSRTDDVAFTGDLKGNIFQGIAMARQNPIADFLLPFWKVPVNGIGWILNRDVMIALPKQLLMEADQRMSRLDGGEMKYSLEEMSDARARAVTAMAVAATTHLLWENGFFTDGGGFDPRQRERNRRVTPPYAFSVAGTMLGAAKFQGNGVDVIDLMGLQADVARAWHEGVISSKDAGDAAKKLLVAYGNIIKNKAGLKGITAVLNWAQDPDRYDAGRTLASQMGGLLPLSGMLSFGSRSLNDPEERIAARRSLSQAELAAMGVDPIMRTIQPVFDLLQTVAVGANANYPVVGLSQPRERDWLGNTIERPFGLPVDLTIPFAPVIKPADPLYQWLAKHGFGDKPRANGVIAEDGIRVQMSNQEEDFYREKMRTVTGTMAPEELGLGAGRLIPIAQYVIGKDLQGALRLLMRDPQYNAMLNSPAGGISPSLEAQPGKPLSKRLEAGGSALYAPIDDIIKYYDHLALMELIKSPDFRVRERVMGLAKQKQDSLQQFANSVSPQGSRVP